jgi:alpha 1,3-glucosidase
VEESSSGSVVSSLMNLVSGGQDSHQQTHWFSEAGIIDLYLFIGPSPKDVVRQYGTITGTTPLPQKFALGYHQVKFTLFFYLLHICTSNSLVFKNCHTKSFYSILI